MPVPDQALTIPTAAEHVKFSTSTLRSYVQAWEQAFGPLPKDRAGHIRLVKPLLNILNDAHRLWPTRLDHGERLNQVLIPDPVTKFLRIVEAYRSCSSTQALVGVERFGNKVMNSALLYLVGRINDSESAQADDNRELEEATEGEVKQILLDLSDFAAVHAQGLTSLATAIQGYADRMTKAASYFSKAAAEE